MREADSDHARKTNIIKSSEIRKATLTNKLVKKMLWHIYHLFQHVYFWFVLKILS